MRIRVVTDQVQQVANRIKSENDESLTQLIERVKILRNELEGQFTGRRADRILKIYDEWIEQMEQKSAELDRIARILKSSAKAFRSIDAPL